MPLVEIRAVPIPDLDKGLDPEVLNVADVPLTTWSKTNTQPIPTVFGYELWDTIDNRTDVCVLDVGDEVLVAIEHLTEPQ